jgi:LAO/AO transport system kinase
MKGEVQALVRDAGVESPARVRAAARLLTLIENEPERLPELFAGRTEWPQPRMVIGITGPPGCGKSVLVDRLISEWRARHAERRIGVIAVDPSSPFTGGAFLGDRIRMMGHAEDPLVFIRSTASRGHVGGLTKGVRGMIHVMGLLDCDVVLIETVGAGQSDVEVAQVADLVVVVLAPGQGDGIQLLKAGFMEAGDLYVVNKSDQDGAAQLYARLLAIAPLVSQHRREGKAADVCLVSALGNHHIAHFVDRIEASFVENRERWQDRHQAALAEEITAAILEESRRQVVHALRNNGCAGARIAQVLRGEVSVPDLVRSLLKSIVTHEPQGVLPDA